jgi:DNA-binding LacI/PurR family transcriptional regulator
MHRRPVLRNVAQAAGVHLSTAARALKNDPRISAQTRLKVRAAAKQLGYVSDPMMTAFAAYRQKVRTTSFRGTLAWVTNFPDRDGWHNQASDLYHAGAKERALELGYDLQHFWLRDPGMTARRAGTILIARGIRGLLICPQPRECGHLSINWSQFAAVAFGYSMARPRIHRVTTSHFRSVVTTVRHLRALGYERIGWACPRHMDNRMEHLWTAAFHSERQTLPQSRDIPIFNESPFLKADFVAWFKKWRIQAIITTTKELVIEWLNETGYRVPQDVGAAFLNVDGADNHLSGIDERSKVIGFTAVDLLASMLQRGEYGIPQDALTVLVEGIWIAGKTVAPRFSPTISSRKHFSSQPKAFLER